METQATIGALPGSLFWGAVKRLIASRKHRSYFDADPKRRMCSDAVPQHDS